jgi:hypothetical protein
MRHENNFQLLRDRVLELQTALFYDLSESVLRLPPTVVQTLDVDEADQLWFVMPRPVQQVSEFDTSFPVQLNYFRKNAPYSLNILGRGYMVHDPEERCNWSLLHQELGMIDASSVLIKVKITRAEMQEWELEPSPVAKLVNRVLAWLNMLDTGKRMYQLIH